MVGVLEVTAKQTAVGPDWSLHNSILQRFYVPLTTLALSHPEGMAAGMEGLLAEGTSSCINRSISDGPLVVGYLGCLLKGP